ncbi:hypothetical protein IFT86_01400 [Pseudomonas syringae]|uniref:hypothetical protein n=1 Tax=Pseudomonas syringae TaxID=317 RepID=UPI001781FAA3|nr:hypothetical protein [Pseudomonas syringae]
MNKIVYVKAHFRPIGEEVTVKVPTGEMTWGLFGTKEETRKEKQWQQTGWSDCEVDGERLSKDIEEAVAQLNADGYEIQTILPILSGAYNYEFKHKDINFPEQMGASGGGWGYGYGYGYSFTEGVTLIARKIQNPSV